MCVRELFFFFFFSLLPFACPSLAPVAQANAEKWLCHAVFRLWLPCPFLVFVHVARGLCPCAPAASATGAGPPADMPPAPQAAWAKLQKSTRKPVMFFHTQRKFNKQFCGNIFNIVWKTMRKIRAGMPKKWLSGRVLHTFHRVFNIKMEQNGIYNPYNPWPSCRCKMAAGRFCQRAN